MPTWVIFWVIFVAMAAILKKKTFGGHYAENPIWPVKIYFCISLIIYYHHTKKKKIGEMSLPGYITDWYALSESWS